LTLSYDEPHGPSICPEPFCSMYQNLEALPCENLVDSLEDKPRYQQLWGNANRQKTMEEMTAPNQKRSMLCGCNSFVDYQVGKVLDVMERDYPEALIIFTSDHGDALGAHRLSAKGASVYDEISNIPLIIAGKGIKPQVNLQPTSHADLVPTILQWFQKPIPKLLEGKSLKDQLLGRTEKVNDYVFTEFTRYEVDHDGFGGLQMMRAVITDRYKLAIHLLDTDEFYDNQIDPYEMHNLICDPQYSELRNQLHEVILERMNQTRDPYRGYQWRERSWRKNDVETLWAVDGYTRQRENEEYEPRQLDYNTGLPMTEAVRKKGK
ncbi:MAG: sulfatase-like hydrolase/transferase, partial [Hungatella sp.]